MERLRFVAARGSQLLDDLTSFASITSENEPSTVSIFQILCRM